MTRSSLILLTQMMVFDGASTMSHLGSPHAITPILATPTDRV
jgi:hypothetical protein